MSTEDDSVSNPSEVDDFEYDVELSDRDRSTPDSDDSKLKPACTCENCQKAPCDHTIVLVERMGNIIPYIIPSFPFMTAKLLHIKFQVYGDDETVYDGFLGAEGACSTTAVCEGSVLKICHGHQNAFLIPQKEFKQSIATAGLVLIDDSLVFVIWKWHVLAVDEEDEDEKMSLKMSDLCELEADEEEENNESNSMDVVHALTFKCIGTTKEDRYQEILVEANLQRRSGKEVHVRLTPEPSNCYDSEAIAFECRTSAENRWERIGYIVSEVLQDVHQAIRSNSIVSIYFDWIRFITHWSRSTPGWYCGIKISRVGPWSKICLKHRSSL